MPEETAFYYINDLKLVAKMENFIPYVYDKKGGWQVDNNNCLMDRLMGYDDDEIGSTSELVKIEEISEEEALRIIEAS